MLKSGRGARFVLLLISVALPFGAAAQTNGSRIVVAPPPGIEASDFDRRDVSGEVLSADVAALRYYARTDQQEKFEKLRRSLQTIDPTWSAGQDVIVSGSGVDPTPVWDLIAEDAYSKAEARLAELQDANPDWRPPSDLRQALRLGKARKRMMNAKEAEQWEQVIAIAEDNRELMTCDNLDLVWTTAKAYIEENYRSKALGLYRTIIQDCATTKKRFDTLRIADKYFDLSELSPLVELEREHTHNEEEAAEFADIVADLRSGTLAQAAEGSKDLGEGLLKRLAEGIRERQNVRDANLMGWYHFNRDNYRAAADWFQASINWEATPGAAMGLARTMRRQGNLAGAEQIAWSWRENQDLAGLFSEIAVERLTERSEGVGSDNLERYKSYARETQNAPVAVALGWYFYNSDEAGAAQRWFERAMNWDPSADAVEGLALSLAATNRYSALDNLIERRGDTYPWLRELRRNLRGAAGEVAKASEAGNYQACVAEARRLQGTDRYDAPTALEAGWCAMENGSEETALAFFRDAADLADDSEGDVRGDALSGQAIALMDMGRPEDALEVVNKAEPGAGVTENLRAGIVARMASRAFSNEQYHDALKAVERAETLTGERSRELSMIKAWSHYHLGNLRRASSIFRRLDEERSTPETRRALRTVVDLM